MAASNKTTNYGLPQWAGTDKPTWQGDMNDAFLAIDTAMKANADASLSNYDILPITAANWDNADAVLLLKKSTD